MCIACELGYWSMIDALDAERSASKEKNARTDEAGFVCEPASEPPRRESSQLGTKAVPDERTP
jgi:hypothetical protein